MIDDNLFESKLMHLIRAEDLNHHGTLFAGQMAKWLLEAGVIAASSICGKAEDVVCIRLEGMTFEKPINIGDIIEIRTKIAFLGVTSITVLSEVFRKDDRLPLVSNMAIFVTVDKNNKPYKHGLVLPEEYIKNNLGIYERAGKIKPKPVRAKLG